MPVRTSAAVFNSMHERPFWKLLSAGNAACVIAMLRHRLFDNNHPIPAPTLYAQLDQDLELLNASGYDMPQPSKIYVRQWVNAGYVVRRYPVGTKEEEFELSADAASAIRFIVSQTEHRPGLSESRLSTVLQELERLVEDTDLTPESRRERLLSEQRRIADELAKLERGEFQVISSQSAEERIQNILSLTISLPDDFITIRNNFEQLHRSLREKIIKESGVSGEILDTVFAGVGNIDASEAGRSFTAFWRMLTNPEKRNAIDSSIAVLENRELLANIDAETWSFLRRLTVMLLERAGRVHDVVMMLSQSLKQFVQSREYREQGTLRRLLTEARQQALELVDAVPPQAPLGLSLWLTTASLSSLSRWTLYDPEESSMDNRITEAEPAAVSDEELRVMIAESEIDWSGLEDRIRLTLQERDFATIGDVLARFPADQGLGSVVGLVSLACDRKAVPGSVEEMERVEWETEEGETRCARVPLFYFTPEEFS